MSDEASALPNGVEESIRRALALEDSRIVYSPMSGSKQGTCVRVEVVDDPSAVFVLKRFSPARDISPSGAAAEEFRALRLFSDALASANHAVLCPTPVRLFEQEAAYLMRLVRGETLDRRFSRGPVGAIVAGRIAEGLGVYYEAVEASYMDFHPGNVIVDRDIVAMIDPTLPDPFFRHSDLGVLHPGAADLGYWAFTECAKGAKRSFLRRSGNRERFRFLGLLIHEMEECFAAGDRSEYRSQVRAVAGRHLDRLRRTRGHAGRFLYHTGNRLLDRAMAETADR